MCNGAGVIDTELGYMDTVTTVCEACGGRRYSDDVLQYRLDGPVDDGGRVVFTGTPAELVARARAGEGDGARSASGEGSRSASSEGSRSITGEYLRRFVEE